MSGTVTIALAGNPNVGKSTVFNALTGLRQHTGNWPGKTVSSARGTFSCKSRSFSLVDLPGTYSLACRSPEEAVTRDFLTSGAPDLCVVVCDATCLERNLILVLQVAALLPRVLVCVNLMDEARRRGIRVDLPGLRRELALPVIGISARRRGGTAPLRVAICTALEAPPRPLPKEAPDPRRTVILAEGIAATCVCQPANSPSRAARMDKLVTGKWTAAPLMLLLLGLILWLTISGANYPSQLLSRLLTGLNQRIGQGLELLGTPPLLRSLLVDGACKTLFWVVSVMLPPMAIFFPLFTLLEDAGYLPRVAFNLDSSFRRAHACGKQALTLCMGLGCNAVGVTACRIIDSPRERLLAILTNSFTPCNGRFPTLSAIILMFFVGFSTGFLASLEAAGLMLALLLLSLAMTLLISWLLSKTMLRGLPSAFTLELPPYRRPQFGKVILRSILDRTLFVLGRAAAVAFPAGILIWVLANVQADGQTLLALCTGALDPLARLFGLDGVILMAFLLGFPANEIVVPVIIMAYLSSGSLTELSSLPALSALLAANGWTWITALCTLIFSLLHWPCATTCLTIKKETKSLRWTLVSILLPTLCGLTLCFLTANLCRLFFPG